MKKTVLIFTASFGHGHTQAAQVLEEACKREGANAKTLDLLTLLPSPLKALLIFTYENVLTYAPTIWRMLYHEKKVKQIVFFQRLLTLLAILMEKKLQETIEEAQPDRLVSTHPFVPIMLARLKKNMCPLYAVMTDFAFHPFYVHPRIDHYFCADPNFVMEAKAWGVQRGQVTYSGIPCRTIATAEQLELFNDEKKRIVLIAGGGRGFMNYRTLVESLNHLSEQVLLVCMVGDNSKVMKRFDELKRKSVHELIMVPFTKYFLNYLQAADVVITKAGGLTLSEGLSLKKRMIIFNPLPGHEEDNANFLTRQGSCEWGRDAEKVTSLVEKFLHDQTSQQQTIGSAPIAKTAAETIVQKILSPLSRPFPSNVNADAFYVLNEENKRQQHKRVKRVK